MNAILQETLLNGIFSNKSVCICIEAFTVSIVLGDGLAPKRRQAIM